MSKQVSISEEKRTEPTLLSGSVPTKYSAHTLPKLSIKDWPDKPLLLTVHPNHNDYHEIDNNINNNNCIPINKVFDIETSLFKGKALCRAIGMKTTEKWYFKNKHRKMCFTYQGTFKKKIRFDRLFTGQIFNKSFDNLPGKKLINSGLKLIKKLAPQLIADVTSNNPHLISPVCSAAQVIHIQKINDKGKIINPLPKAPIEDVSILDKKYKGLNWEKRKKLFNNKELIKKYYFEPGYIYTISNYSHMISPSKYKLHLAGFKFSIANYIPTPMQINTILLPDNEQKKNNNYAITNDDNDNTIIEWSTNKVDLKKCQYLYNIQIWHTDMHKKISTQKDIEYKNTEKKEN